MHWNIQHILIKGSVVQFVSGQNVFTTSDTKETIVLPIEAVLNLEVGELSML